MKFLKQINEKVSQFATAASSAAILSLPNLAMAQAVTASGFAEKLTTGTLGGIITAAIVIAAVINIVKALPDLLSGQDVWGKLSQIVAWVAIAIWWDDMIKQLLSWFTNG